MCLIIILKLSSFRFKTFEVSLKDITELVERWDRTIGAPRLPTNLGHESDEQHPPHSGRKGKKEKGDKHKHDSLDKDHLLKATEKDKEVR